jgi:hypothetical protein
LFFAIDNEADGDRAPKYGGNQAAHANMKR